MIELSYGHKRQNGKPAETGRGKTSNQQWQRKVWQSEQLVMFYAMQANKAISR